MLKESNDLPIDYHNIIETLIKLFHSYKQQEAFQYVNDNIPDKSLIKTQAEQEFYDIMIDLRLWLKTYFEGALTNFEQVKTDLNKLKELKDKLK